MAIKIRKCDRCGSRLNRNGKQWMSAKKQVQRWRCPKCGHTTIKKANKE